MTNVEMIETIASAISRWKSEDPSFIREMPRAARARNPRKASPVVAAPVAPVAVDEPVVVPGSMIPVGHRILRPNGTPYICRRVRDGLDLSDVQWVRACHESDLPILLYGPPGTGKTALLEAAFGDRMLTLLGSEDTERADFEGTYVQAADGAYVWVDGPLVRAMEGGLVLFVDEVGLVSPKVLSLLYGAMDGRQEIRVLGNPERGVVRARPGFMVVAATNPDAPGVRLSEALLSRFLSQALMTTDWSVARTLGVPRVIVSALENLEKKRIEGEVSSSPQMREALAFVKIEKAFGRDIALANLVAASQESHRDVIADVLSRATGSKISGLALA